MLARSMPSCVTLREITRDNVLAILKLEVREDQKGMVASNAASLAQALVHEEAWYRAIYAGEEPVGFVMLEMYPDKGEYGIWRFMVAEAHQGRGYGRAAIDLVLEHVRQQPGATEVFTSHVSAPGDPGPFYEVCGFAYTGEMNDAERVMRRKI